MNNIVTYEPDNSLKKGYLSLYREIFHELKQNRWLTFQLFKRDFFAAYKQSFIGIVWIVILPVLSVSTFIVLNRSGIFDIGQINVPYPLFGLLGMAFWQLFARGLVIGTNSLAIAGTMITKINFSKKSLVFASTAHTIVGFLIQSILVSILFIFYGLMPNKGILLVPIVILPLLCLSLGLSLILSLLNAIVRDVTNAMTMLMTFLLFLTPVLYAKPKIGILMYLTRYNPLYYMVSAGRDLILTGTISEVKGFTISAIFSIIIFMISLVLFHLTETRITERV